MKIEQILEDNKRLIRVDERLWEKCSVAIFVGARRYLRKMLEEGYSFDMNVSNEEFYDMLDAGVQANGSIEEYKKIKSLNYKERGFTPDPFIADLWSDVWHKFENLYSHSLKFDHNVEKLFPILLEETHEWIRMHLRSPRKR